jgi:hypothetical protein
MYLKVRVTELYPSRLIVCYIFKLLLVFIDKLSYLSVQLAEKREECNYVVHQSFEQAKDNDYCADQMVLAIVSRFVMRCEIENAPAELVCIIPIQLSPW